MWKNLATVALLVAAPLALAGCGGDDPAGTAAHNDADVSFAHADGGFAQAGLVIDRDDVALAQCSDVHGSFSNECGLHYGISPAARD